MMRVLFVMTARTVGGAELYAGALMRELATACAFTLAASEHPDLDRFTEEARSHAASVVRFPFDQGRKLPAVTRDLVRLARQHDVIHLNSNHPGSRLGILLGFALPLARRPVVAVEHSATPIANIEVPRWIAPALPLLFRLSRRGVSRVVAISQASAAMLTGLYGLPAGKITLIHNGVDLSRLAAPAELTLRRELGLSAGQSLILALGRLNTNKGYADLFAALAALGPRFPTVHLAWAGPADEREAAERLLTELGVTGRAALLGFRSDVANLLHSSDVLVQGSRAEGFGLTVVEALAAGLPVVATRAGIAPEVISDGRNGFLVPPGDVPALAAALARALSLTPNERAAFSDAARAAAAPFSLKEMARKTLDLYLAVRR